MCNVSTVKLHSVEFDLDLNDLLSTTCFVFRQHLIIYSHLFNCLKYYHHTRTLNFAAHHDENMFFLRIITDAAVDMRSCRWMGLVMIYLAKMLW